MYCRSRKKQSERIFQWALELATKTRYQIGPASLTMARLHIRVGYSYPILL